MCFVRTIAIVALLSAACSRSGSEGSSAGDSLSPGDSAGSATGDDTAAGDIANPGDAAMGDIRSGDAVEGDSSTGDSSTGDSSTGDSSTGDSSTGGDEIAAPVHAECPADSDGYALREYELTGAVVPPPSSTVMIVGWTLISAPAGHVAISRQSGTTVRFFADVVGRYTYEFAIASEGGEVATCRTVVDTTSEDILRVELSWNADYDGSAGPDLTDFDLYLMRDPNGQSAGWYYFRDPISGQPRQGPANPNSCHWLNCATCPADINSDPIYASHPCHQLSGAHGIRECLCREFVGNPPDIIEPGSVWPPPVLDWDEQGLPDDDPRLDLDDAYGHGPEITSVRMPAAGTYRVAAHYYNANDFGSASTDGCRHTTALVRIYCGNEVVFTSEPVDMRATDVADAYWQNDLWEIGDVTITYPAGVPKCGFAEFGSEGARQICKLDLSDDGCAESDSRVCDEQP